MLRGCLVGVRRFIRARTLVCFSCMFWVTLRRNVGGAVMLVLFLTVSIGVVTLFSWLCRLNCVSVL